MPVSNKSLDWKFRYLRMVLAVTEYLHYTSRLKAYAAVLSFAFLLAPQRRVGVLSSLRAGPCRTHLLQLYLQLFLQYLVHCKHSLNDCWVNA